MQTEKSQPTNLIFWGAGATAALGMPTTQQQADFVRKLVASGILRNLPESASQMHLTA
jgi:hypothetical protein